MGKKTDVTASGQSVTRRTLHYFMRVTANRKGVFAAAILVSVGYSLFLSYGNPYLMGRIVDLVSVERVASDQVLPTFGPLVAALILTNLLGQICSKLQDYMNWKLQIGAAYDLARLCFDTLSNQSMTFHTNRFGGSLVAQTSKFIGGYRDLCRSLLFSIVPTCASVFFTMTILGSVVPAYAAVLGALLVVYLAAAYLMYKRVLPLNAGAASAQSRLSGELSDSVTNILAVKTCGREGFERQLFDVANEHARKAESARMRASMNRGVVTAGIIVIIMATASIFTAGGNAWFNITPGNLIMMFTYTYTLTQQFNFINIVFQNVNGALGDAHDMTVILDEPKLVQDAPHARSLVVREGAIDIDDLTFSYADGQEGGFALDHFDLHIPAGQRVGLVGRSGSGKTTLTSLLLRLADIQSGSIRIDGQDISQVKQVSLRSQIGYVPQEPLLFHRTIRENIAYGRPDATDKEIWAAARDANALEFIEKLPAGMDTQTGERGVKLSGGQRQRIAIARAILANCPILVLDEATSALDSESEHLVQDALNNLMRGRTCIVVAHRLSTVASLDRIVVMSEGRVVEDGTHDQLTADDGIYAKLWDRQTGSFLES
ncbi:ABC transporter ATP-binding protein [Gordonibacter sp. Marseille-P4307]|uniref:ABC transporter ATP-binding protein n=1 Tax=Gordonibacter sp. Marseille-P4307 TaxID=2161815 RepID=UPI000F548ACD|nr:ABC transporter ATP-binding protein [Gordonibacter sp. Marseille-P4307]